MSKIYRSSQIILDDQKYTLSTKITLDQHKQSENKAHPNPSEEDELFDSDEKKYDKDELLTDVKREALMLKKEAEEEYERITSEAQKESETVIAAAYDKAKEIYENSKQQGFNEGYQEGYKESKAEADHLIAEALRIKEHVKLERDSIYQEIEPAVIKLVIDTTEKILNKKIADDKELVFNLVKSAIERATFSTDLVLRVSTEDFEIAMELKNKILAIAENVDDIIIKQDYSLQKGSCILDTNSGSVESSIWTQFEQIRETFEELFKND